MKASDLFVKCLENEGVEYIFGVPGEENLDLVESLRTSNIKLIVTRHEQVAGFMAANFGRLTGKAGVCLSTLGPGATNFVTSSAYANLGAMPVIFITGQKPIKHSKQGHFQIIDTVEIMRPVTKLSKQIITGNSIAGTVREAFRLAEEERPGAIHLVLPEDIAVEETNVKPFSRNKIRRPIAEAKAILQAVELIKSAKSPLLLIGAGANRKLTSKMLSEFIEKTKIPFFNTQMGKGVVDERNPFYLGTAALSSGDFLHCAIEKADLIINIGHDVVEKPPFIMTQSDKRKVIHINFFSANVDNIYFPDLEVVGDIANAIWQIKESLEPQKHWDFSYYMKIKQKIEDHIRRDEDSSNFPIIPQKIVKTVREIMPDDGIVALDNGMYKLWFARNYKAYLPNTLLLDNALATMGAGLPSSMMAKMIYPDKKVLCVAGDGGFMMNSQDLETAIRLKLDLVILILNDSGYGMIKWKQEGMDFENFGLDFGNPDFVKYAESYGAKGYRVNSSDNLKELLNQTLNSKGIHIIDCPIDYSENIKVFTKELKERSCEV